MTADDSHSVAAASTRKRRASGDDSGSTDDVMSTRPPPPKHHRPSFVHQQQLESLQAELDYERNLRLLDQKRARQDQERLQRQVELALQEARDAREHLDEYRVESERTTTQLKQAHKTAMADLRQCQVESEERSWEEEDESEVEYWKHQFEHATAQLSSARTQLEEHKSDLQQCRNEFAQHLEQYQKTNNVADSSLSPHTEALLVQDAPPEILRELHTTRLQRQDAERQSRQLQRQVDQLNGRVKELVREREQARQQAAHLPTVEANMRVLRVEHEQLVATHQAWQAFGRELQTTLQLATESHHDHKSTTSMAPPGPPEVATVTRRLHEGRHQVLALQTEKQTLRARLQEWQDTVATYKSRMDHAESNVRQLELQERQLQDDLSRQRRALEQKEHEQALAQREIDSLRALMKTYDALPLLASPQKGETGRLHTAADAMRVELDHVKGNVELLRNERDQLVLDLDGAMQAKQDLDQQLHAVKTKFAKLKDALLEERQKVATATERALEAERLAGQGSFDVSVTRVMHLADTPLVQALRDEVQVLQRQLKSAQAEESTRRSRKSSSSGGGGGGGGPDPEKLNQRLKENFREQIGLFREGVYLITGFKIDMLPNTDRPTFRVRSVFAEQESDHLMLKFPKGAAADSVTSLDILNTDFAKQLSTTPSYQYMTKFQSLPAFVASAQLSLFEKQTVMIG